MTDVGFRSRRKLYRIDFARRWAFKAVARSGLTARSQAQIPSRNPPLPGPGRRQQAGLRSLCACLLPAGDSPRGLPSDPPGRTRAMAEPSFRPPPRIVLVFVAPAGLSPQRRPSPRGHNRRNRIRRLARRAAMQTAVPLRFGLSNYTPCTEGPSHTSPELMIGRLMSHLFFVRADERHPHLELCVISP